MRDRERLIARIRQIRRARDGGTTSPTPSEADRMGRLEARVEHLESLVQGLQDSVHRESSRHARMIAELETRLQPAALSKALSEDARARGI
jgi:hypothetical protein